MTKIDNRLATILESLSDISITLVSDFVGEQHGGLPVAIALSQLGVNVFPVGVIGEDAAGQQVHDALHAQRISTSGMSKIKKYSTPAHDGGGNEQIDGEHPALLNLIEHARKFASASDAMYVCDYGIGAAGPRVLNFIKSNGCVREKVLMARSLHRLEEFEQLTSAISTEEELERIIGAQIGGNAEKLAVAGEGMLHGLQLDSFLLVSSGVLLTFTGTQKPKNQPMASGNVEVLGAIFAAAMAADAEVSEAVQLADRAREFLATRGSKRHVREELLNFLASAKAARHTR